MVCSLKTVPYERDCCVYLLYFQLKTAWKSSSITGYSPLMNKRSQFKKIFSQAILDIKLTGKLDIFEAVKHRGQSEACNQPDPMGKSLGYKKLAFLFAVLASAIFISLFIALFEFFVKMFQIQKNQKPTTTINEENHIDDNLRNIMNNMSKDDIIERILRRVHKEEMFQEQ